MRQIFFVTLIWMSMLILSACSAREPYFSEEYQVKNHADGEISTFGLNIAPATQMGEWVVDWIADVSEGDGFQYFIYSDPDSWDVYLYYPKMQRQISELTNSDIDVECSDGTLKVYVTENTEENTLTDDAQEWMVHFAAQPRGTWPSRVELYWNDVEVPCDATKINGG